MYPTFDVILIGEESLLREGISRILRSADFRIVASVPSAYDLHAIELPEINAQADEPLFLLVRTSDDRNATAEQIKALRARRPDAPIAVVPDRCRLSDLVSAFRAGAKGYLAGAMTCEAFIKSVELVAMGEVVFPPAFLAFVPDSEGEDLSELRPIKKHDRPVARRADKSEPRLSPRENSIMRCLIGGDSNKCIARKIDIAEATVKVHIKAILRKIQVENRTQAAIWGMTHAPLAGPPNATSTPLSIGADGHGVLPPQGRPTSGSALKPSNDRRYPTRPGEHSTAAIPPTEAALHAKEERRRLTVSRSATPRR
jgi:two-component system nitrate/nitrite response regulator NarL